MGAKHILLWAVGYLGLWVFWLLEFELIPLEAGYFPTDFAGFSYLLRADQRVTLPGQTNTGGFRVGLAPVEGRRAPAHNQSNWTSL